MSIRRTTEDYQCNLDLGALAEDIMQSRENVFMQDHGIKDEIRKMCDQMVAINPNEAAMYRDAFEYDCIMGLEDRVHLQNLCRLMHIALLNIGPIQTKVSLLQRIKNIFSD